MRRIRAATAHAFLALLEAALIATLLVGLVAGTALAGKGGGGGKPSGGGGGSISLVMVNPSDSVANWGDQVKFGVSTSYAYPIVSLVCSQGGTVVYGDSRPYYSPNLWDDPGIFTLASLSWTAGTADCRADLKGLSGSGKTVVLASTSFHVNP
jgi:hypothetical protein